ncbi:hypothetical protein A5672_16955 [Mycobacterium alsense]|uniref:Uncharacterized protein n=1 Tax=Mycobacterium alsense TaxID=324058 RepID=A0ABD6P0I1_9MYCO|nr:hypothetical protein [Mycobacterium alsense]OBG37993.1 hypothetical protein A5672_16955 [Mycobacterium alsense]
MADNSDHSRRHPHELPPEYFLPPATNAALWAETVKLVAGSFAFILVLAIVVVLTQGIVIKV